MKRIFNLQYMLLLFTVILLSSFSVTTDPANFSGQWKLDESKSELGDFGGRFAPRTVKVEQNANAITISKTAPSFDGGENTSTETLSFDGKESETTVFGSSKKKSTAKWSDDGQTLTISYMIAFERDGQITEIKGTETWTLKDGLLSLVTMSSSAMGEFTMKAVYGK